MTKKPKSNGVTTHYQARFIGEAIPEAEWFTRADSEVKKEALVKNIKMWNERNPEDPMELVRVEVTPT